VIASLNVQLEWSERSDPVNGFELKDERTGIHEKPFTGVDPTDRHAISFRNTRARNDISFLRSADYAIERMGGRVAVDFPTPEGARRGGRRGPCIRVSTREQ